MCGSVINTSVRAFEQISTCIAHSRKQCTPANARMEKGVGGTNVNRGNSMKAPTSIFVNWLLCSISVLWEHNIRPIYICLWDTVLNQWQFFGLTRLKAPTNTHILNVPYSSSKLFTNVHIPYLNSHNHITLANLRPRRKRKTQHHLLQYRQFVKGASFDNRQPIIFKINCTVNATRNQSLEDTQCKHTHQQRNMTVAQVEKAGEGDAFNHDKSTKVTTAILVNWFTLIVICLWSQANTEPTIAICFRICSLTSRKESRQRHLSQVTWCLSSWDVYLRTHQNMPPWFESYCSVRQIYHLSVTDNHLHR